MAIQKTDTWNRRIDEGTGYKELKNRNNAPDERTKRHINTDRQTDETHKI